MQSLGFLYHTAEHKFGDLSLPKADMLMFFYPEKDTGTDGRWLDGTDMFKY
ncbi:hypothetical protein CLOBOL_05286 [Enterocloster bolteae ATCC BAA-613]|uniref:Uncharacterized protein n=1 Tax=Enterocloster bolteae (strain ATCC BAA-613 / DSM 15670 / CCUG 46953 / JCM 12243 / WAL 16351) TaxID=411902 RepID=A8RZ08_ENTBW|nr:hypothetical protein CLOBOL_05286 [Enterocloster bolteae ATCC BAA-613]